MPTPQHGLADEFAEFAVTWHQSHAWDADNVKVAVADLWSERQVEPKDATPGWLAQTDVLWVVHGDGDGDVELAERGRAVAELGKRQGMIAMAVQTASLEDAQDLVADFDRFLGGLGVDGDLGNVREALSLPGHRVTMGVGWGEQNSGAAAAITAVAQARISEVFRAWPPVEIPFGAMMILARRSDGAGTLGDDKKIIQAFRSTLPEDIPAIYSIVIDDNLRETDVRVTVLVSWTKAPESPTFYC